MRPFAALDVETANQRRESICSVGVVVFVDGEPQRELYQLVNPRTDFRTINIAIHGIRPEHVADEPTWSKVQPILSQFIGTLPVYHYTPFDRTAVRHAARRARIAPPAWTWVDASTLVRRAWPERRRRGYGLGPICKLIGHEFNHHDALADARACGVATVAAMRRLSPHQRPTHPRAKTRPQPTTNPAPPSNQAFSGQRIVFTGAMSISHRELTALAQQHGATVAATVSRRTTLVVAADTDLHANSRAAKLREARRLTRCGYPLKIIGETQFRRQLIP